MITVSPTRQPSGTSASLITVSPVMGASDTFRNEVFSAPWISTWPCETIPRDSSVGSQLTSMSPLFAIRILVVTPASIGFSAVPISSRPLPDTTSVSTIILVLASVAKDSSPSTRTVKSETSLSPS